MAKMFGEDGEDGEDGDDYVVMIVHYVGKWRLIMIGLFIGTDR